MHVHLVGVAGTGMGTLAGLLKAAGHRVTGSDTAFHPPMGEALARYGVETRTGFEFGLRISRSRPPRRPAPGERP
jgi:UDP-N-acetylmuramate: L-alanyl-gamma-D-glutamyl-meso-diaminopimelate ligase